MNNKKSKNYSGIIEFATDNVVLTKKDKQAQRIISNKIWKSKIKQSDEYDEDPNPRHTLYYKLQLPYLENQWHEIHQSFARPLPLSFRLGHSSTNSIKKSSSIAHCIQKSIEDGLSKVNDIYVHSSGNNQLSSHRTEDNRIIMTEISWMNKSAWTLFLDSSSLSKEPRFKHVHDMISQYVELGYIIRQEVVSMLPARVLDIKPYHLVIDLCSAPGSKTEQVLSIMHAQSSSTSHHMSGLVIANDSDPKRIERLRVRYSRSGNACLALVNSPAEELVDVLPRGCADRIICDVPCTGDGTFRKSPHLWRLFRPRMAAEIHPLQLQIAMAGVKLLAQGGRMCYSTCSINPIEDEAVVAALLRVYKGCLRLVDIRNEIMLSELITHPGLSSWRSDMEVFLAGDVTDKDCHDTISKMPAILASMHAPSIEESSWMHLEYCMRVMPHDQDTGGFFVAVLERYDVDDIDEVEKDTRRLISQDKVMAVQSKLGYNPKTRIDHHAKDANQHQGYEYMMIHDDALAALKSFLRGASSDDDPAAIMNNTLPLDLDRRCVIMRPTSHVDRFDVYLLNSRMLDMMATTVISHILVSAGVLIGQFIQSSTRFIPNNDNIRCLHVHIDWNSQCKVSIRDLKHMAEIGRSMSSDQRSLSYIPQHQPKTIPITREDAEMMTSASSYPPPQVQARTIAIDFKFDIIYDIQKHTVATADDAIILSSTIRSSLSRYARKLVDTPIQRSVPMLMTVDIQSAPPSLSTTSTSGVIASEAHHSVKRRLSRAEQKKLKHRRNMDDSTCLPSSSTIDAGCDITGKDEMMVEPTSSSSEMAGNHGMYLVFMLSQLRRDGDNMVISVTRITKPDSCDFLAKTICPYMASTSLDSHVTGSLAYHT